MEAVVEDLQGLEDVSPVLPLVVQPLVQHVHDVHKVGAAIIAICQNRSR